MQVIGGHHASWEEWFAVFGIRPYVVRYEVVDAGMAVVTRGVLSFRDSVYPEDA